MNELTLSPQVFAIWAALLEEAAGLHYPPEDKDLLGGKLSLRATELGFDSLLDYFYFIRYDQGGANELETLLETLVVGETYFFREYEQLEVAVDDFLVPLVDAGQRPRVWCAAAATGEEPLTLAMMLARRGALERTEIVASDLSARSLARARAGRYGKRSVRIVPDQHLAKRWLEGGPEEYQVSSTLREAIHWRRLNLINAREVAALGSFDLILCRNVLIYFRDSQAAKVVSSLAGCLKPGGVLFVGVSESLLRFGTSLLCDERRGIFFYRRNDV